MVDYLWYRRKVPGAYTDASGFDVIDEWGRMVPDPDRWPSSKGGKGFTEVAKKVHSMGLKFGIHVMRGISAQAVNADTPILDTTKVSLLLMPRLVNELLPFCHLIYQVKIDVCAITEVTFLPAVNYKLIVYLSYLVFLLHSGSCVYRGWKEVDSK